MFNMISQLSKIIKRPNFEITISCHRSSLFLQLLKMINYDVICFTIESWCELHYKSGCSSTGSISHLNHSVNPEILEKLLQEAQKDSSQRQSPISLLPLLAPPQQTSSPPPLQPHTSHSDSNLIRDKEAVSEAANKSKSTTDTTATTTTTEIIKKCDSVASNAPSSIVNVSSSKSSALGFTDLNYYDDDDVDLEYVEDDEEDDDDDDNDTNILDENGEMSSYGTTVRYFILIRYYL